MPRSSNATVSVVVGALGIAWGVLSFGAVYPWGYWPLAFAALSCGVIGWIGSRNAVPLRLPLALVAVALLTSIQLIPVPRPALGMLSPAAVTLLPSLDVSFALDASAAHALSLAPDATARALTLFVCFAVMLIGLSRALSKHGARRLVEIILATGILVALIGIVQRPLYAGKIYGFWKPLESGSPFGPFVNKNHFAGWMLMAVPLALGLLCGAVCHGMRGVRPDWRSRILWFSSPAASRMLIIAGAALVMGLALVMTMSRSGIGALFVALAITSWQAIRRFNDWSRRVLAASYVAGMIVLITVWVGADVLAARFASSDATLNMRLPIWQDTLPMVHDFWLTGTGLNTYGVASLFYQRALANVHVGEAHNDYLQLAAEGGLLLGVSLLVLVGIFAWEVARRFRANTGSSYWLRLGAVTGIVAIALQSLVEFSLQIPGNAILFTALCAIALHEGESRVSTNGNKHR